MLSRKVIAGATIIAVMLGAAAATVGPASAGSPHGRPGHWGTDHGNFKGGWRGGHRPGAYGGPWRPGWGKGPPGYGPGPMPPRARGPFQPPHGHGPGRCVPHFQTVRYWQPYYGWVSYQVYAGKTCDSPPVYTGRQPGRGGKKRYRKR